METEEFERRGNLVCIFGLIAGGVAGILVYIFVYPVLVSWGFHEIAFAAVVAAIFLVPAASFILYIELDTIRAQARKKSLQTGVMVSVPYSIWVQTHGEERIREKKFDQGTTEIDLNFKKIRSIDLSILHEFKNLEYLDLSNNDIHTIDLSPLSKCDNLRSLSLSRNSISSIDMSPLAECSRLHSLFLADNELTLLDLSPLENCEELEFLHLQENKLQSIDLTPLGSCTKLVNLFIDENPIQVIDITPLRKCMRFDAVAFGEAKLVTTEKLDEGKWPAVIRELSDKIEYQGQ